MKASASSPARFFVSPLPQCSLHAFLCNKSAMMGKALIFFPLLLLLFSCRSKAPVPRNDDAKLQLMEVDRSFSKRSAEAGLKTAYLEYIDSTAVLLRPGNMPLTGANAIDFICNNDDAAAAMTWEPKGCSLASSGDWGYTWGIFSLKMIPGDSLTYGTYVNIWKKQDDGSWKFIVNSGNQGVE